MKTICPFCLQKYEVDERFTSTTLSCPNCNKEFTVEPVKKCPVCESENHSNAEMCNKCKMSFTTAQKISDAPILIPIKKESEEKKRVNRKLIFILLFIFSIIIVILIYNPIRKKIIIMREETRAAELWRAADVAGLLLNESGVIVGTKNPDITYANIPRGVSGIGKSAFKGCDKLQGVTIPDTVLYIEENAFAECRNLTNATISEGVKTLGKYAFSNTGLKQIIIPSSVSVVDTGVFERCNLSNGVTIRKGVKKIEDYAFQNSGTSHIIIPDSVESVGSWAFNDCWRLQNVTIPDSVKNMGFAMFSGCSSLRKVRLPAGLTQINSSMFQRCDKLVDIIIPDKVTSIGLGAFSQCYKLELVIPPNVKDICDDSFEYVQSVKVSKNNPFFANDEFGGLLDMRSNRLLHFPRRFNGHYIIPDGVISISTNAFKSCNLTALTIPESVEKIEKYTFSGCEKIKSVTVLGICKIDKDAFGILWSKPEIHWK